MTDSWNTNSSNVCDCKIKNNNLKFTPDVIPDDFSLKTFKESQNQNSLLITDVNISGNHHQQVIRTSLSKCCNTCACDPPAKRLMQEKTFENSVEILNDKTVSTPIEVDCLVEPYFTDTNRKSFHTLMSTAHQSLVFSHDLVMEDCSVRSVASVGLLNSIKNNSISEYVNAESHDTDSSLGCCFPFPHCWFL